MRILNSIIRANQLLTALGNNYVLRPVYYNTISNKYPMQIYTYENDRACPLPANIYLYNMTEQLGLYDVNKIPLNETLPGLIVDYLPLQMRSASSPECLCQQSCVDVLLSSYQQKINISILNSSQPSRFNPITTIVPLFDEIFL
ncbi:unnamed protein product [Adineta ricciae]|uniref:Uncharacterized protein n=1 Tax=Adineta ricciae TaxID=249248 RepID=A0A816B8Z5_ADIRI|nr:unnamed protein product [Adineta ricciae]CAF1606168.1 unnamed protein product [Adineta ricciae]